MRRLFFVAALALATSVSAQPRGGILRGRIVNGTTGGPGTAEKVTLLRLGGDMTPVAELGAVSGSFEMTGFELEGERPMLVQVTSGGVNYNQPVPFGRGYEADTEVTVYDTFSRWDDAALTVTTSRFLYRRDGGRLLVDKVFVVDNRSEPPRTYHEPDGTFRVSIPLRELEQFNSITASSALGVPVPQQATPLEDGSGYVTKTAFKPGETTLAVSYEVGYENARFDVDGRAFTPLAELMVFFAPPDIQVDAPGWERLGDDPEGRFSAFRLRNLAPGDPIRFSVSGGSERAAPLTSGSSSGEGSRAPARSGGTITRIPDDSSASKWFLVMLMAAALAYGLLQTLWPRTPAKRG